MPGYLICPFDNRKLISFPYRDMKETAADDREANSKGKPAIHKLKMSKLVFSQLMKKDLHDMFLDGGILSGIFAGMRRIIGRS